MKSFNRKRLISSLAVSTMIAVATLSPLATVHAAPANFIQIGNPAHIDLTTTTGLNGIVIPLTYTCAAGAGAPTAITVAVALQTGGGSGSTGNYAGGNPIQGLTCDATSHQVEATIFPDSGTSFIVGTASVTATLITDTNTTVGTPATATVRVV